MIQILSLKHAPKCSQLHSFCFDKKWSEAEFEDFLSTETVVIFGYWDKDILIALLCICVFGNEAEIYTLCTHPHYRKQNIASQLLEKAYQECRDRLITDIFLEVAIDNISAISCYQKNNFKIIGTRKNYYTKNNQSVDAYNMQLEL